MGASVPEGICTQVTCIDSTQTPPGCQRTLANAHKRTLLVWVSDPVTRGVAPCVYSDRQCVRDRGRTVTTPP